MGRSRAAAARQGQLPLSVLSLVVKRC